MTKYLKIAPDPDSKPCRCGDGNPDCDHFEFCPECGEEYKAHEGHDCLDGFAVAQVGTAKELRDAAKELRDALDACETERDRLRAQLAALRAVQQGMDVPDLVYLHEEWSLIRGVGGDPEWDAAVFGAGYNLAKSRARLVPTPPQPLQPEERRVGPDEVVVGREEWETLNAFLEDWRDPESRSLRDWNTSLKAKAARINALRTSAQDETRG